MASNFTDSVRSTSSDLALRELLDRPVSELLGVGDDAAQALETIGVRTIFDLGTSSVFAHAAAAASAGVAPLPGDVLDTGTAIEATADLPLESLRSLDTAEAAALKTALGVETLREFALWHPRVIAHGMVSTGAGTTLEPGEELRPRFGEYPTERVYFDTLVMLGSLPGTNLTPLGQPLSLANLNALDSGFEAPAVGALATYSQSWFAQGVTLGHMVHSLALAPGEATRIAVIDWSRRTRAIASESIDEREQLDSATNHARAVSEVQNAVADEMQSGGSVATGWAKSSSSAWGVAGSIGGGIAGTIGSAVGALGFGGGGSKSSQESETESRATSTSWSVGSRSVLAEMTQRVNDSTEQHSTSVRNRRATAVREVSQTEHEQVSTRIVANYNHMHALTVQYYEVVQIYRVSVSLHKFTRVVFIPFEMLDFTASNATELVARFRGQLLRAALNPRIVDLLLDDRGRVEVRGVIRVSRPVGVDVLGDAGVLGPVGGVTALMARRAPAVTDAAPSSPVAEAPPVGRRITVPRPGPISEVLPGDAKLISIGFDDLGIERVRVDQPGIPAESSTFVVSAATDQVDFPNPIPLRNIEGINVARADGSATSGSMVIRYSSERRESMAVVPVTLTDSTHMQKAAYFAADAANRRAELRDHLQANRAYYTRAIMENLDSATLVMLLSKVTWQGKPLADQIEPNPVAVTGNMLVLRAPAEEGDPSGLGDNQSWGDLLRDRGVDFTKQDTRLVPIPTNGVFAEAVLGRSNSAEKLDITRFWNWQDSPIPLQPPEIEAVRTGTRATPETLTPGQLSTPVLNLVNPTNLPDPAGLSAVLGAVASANMFRDMSGLAGTQAAAQAASAGTLSAATEAGRIASENFKAATNQATEMGKAAADMWKVMKSSESKKSNAGISGAGAQINHGRDLDKRGVPGSSEPKVTSIPPSTFLSSGSTTRPSAETSRELVYSDEAVAASPYLVGSTTAALGSPAGAGGQGMLGFLGSAGDLAASFSAGLGEAIAVAVEAMVLQSIKSDAALAPQSVLKPLGAVKLIPMRKHDNHAGFEEVEFLAWTNSSTHVYINVPLYTQRASDFMSQLGPDDGLKAVRAVAVYVLRHELHHVDQFAGNQNQPPTSWKQMINFEVGSYGDDLTWLARQDVKDFMLNVIGTSQPILDMIADSVTGIHNNVTNFQSLTSEPSRKKAMQDAKDPNGNPSPLLPKEILGNPGYSPADMYKTKAP